MVGEVVRYGESDWSLMKVEFIAEEESGVRVYGTALMGGMVSADISDIIPESEEDWDRWDNCWKYRHRRKNGS